MSLVPAIKKLEQNQNGKLHLEIDYNSHYSSGYRAIHSAVLWVVFSVLRGTLSAKYLGLSNVTEIGEGNTRWDLCKVAPVLNQLSKTP
jgi:hypothetical protein